MGKSEGLMSRISFVWLKFQIVLSEYRQFTYQQDTTFDNLSCSGSVLWTIHDVRTLPDCSILCSNSEACVNFFYNSEIYRCEGRSDSLCKTDTCTSTTSQLYYRLNGVAEVGSGTQYEHIEEFQSCLKTYMTDLDLTSASSQCAADGGHLITITSQDMLDRVLALFEPLHSWGHMHWLIDGRQVHGLWLDWDNKPLTFTSWVSESYTGFQAGNCLRLHGGTIRGIGPSECTAISQIICQID